MKIIHICAFYHPINEGGAEVFAKDLCERLAVDNDVSVITGKFKGDLPDKEVINGVKVNRVPMIMIKNVKLFSFLFTSVIEGWIQRKDVNCYHGTMAFTAGTSAVILKKLTGKKAIVTIQGGDMCDYSENTGKFGKILRPIVSWTLRNADVVHAVSNDLERKAKALGAKNVVVIPNAVDLKLFEKTKDIRGEFFDDNPSKIILSVSRLTHKNGIDTLIRAFSVLKPKHPDWELVIIGDGEEKERLMKLASNEVIFHPPVKHEEISKWYSSADVFCRPSRDEGFGIVFIEAMACGITPVGTMVGGIPDIIKHYENGILVKPDNPEELAEYLEKVLTDDKLRVKLSENALETAKKFSWEGILPRIREMYKSIPL
jgi:glycosyltransferase involved in cell wall biosynthesis